MALAEDPVIAEAKKQQDDFLPVVLGCAGENLTRPRKLPRIRDALSAKNEPQHDLGSCHWIT